MAKLTWLGEDDLHCIVTNDGHTIENAGPSFTIAFGVKFPKGEPVDVKNPAYIAKAKANPYFRVEGVPGRPPKVTNGDDNDQDQS